MDRWKAERGRVREKRRVEERRWQKRKSQKKEDVDARKGRKVAKHGVFSMIWGSGGSNSRLAKAAGAEPFGQMRDEKVHAVVARSTFRSQNVQNTFFSDHFWTLRCRKSARRCGAKHMSKSKCTKQYTSSGPLLEVEMSKMHAVVARSTCRSQNVQSTTCTRHFWRFRCRFAWQAQGMGHLLKSERNVRVLWHFQLQPPLHHTTLQSTTTATPSLHSTTLITLHYSYTTATLHSTTLHNTPLHSTTFNYATLRYTTPHYTTFHYTTLHYTALHCTTLTTATTTTTPILHLHYATLHYTNYITLHYTTLQSTTLHYTTLHYASDTTLRYTTVHYATLHYTEWHCTTPTTTTTNATATTLHYITLH